MPVLYVGHGILIKQVGYARWFRADMKGTDPFLDRKVSLRHSLMLAQVLNPGFKEKAFQKAGRIGCIGKKPPIRGPIAQAEGAQGVHFTDEVV